MNQNTLPHFEATAAFAQQMDAADALAGFKNEFIFPKQTNGEPVVYFCGNSLGLQPKSTKEYIGQELDKWGNLAVEGHFRTEKPWMHYHKLSQGPLAQIVGAKPDEVIAMNNLTVNLHLMLVSFYRPTPKRFKIIMEAGAFPSDQYAMETQVRFHGFDPSTAIIELFPRPNERTLRTEDIVAEINKHADSLALVCMGGINYLTGQVFDMEAITKATHSVGAIAGFDLAHAAGNIPMQLHNWGVDFAVWCTYKYINSGPGSVAGAFVHERHANDSTLPRFAGWWGYEESTRFLMKKGFVPMHGAAGWQLANQNILSNAAHQASLDIFSRTSMDALRAKSELLTSYLEFLLLQVNTVGIQIITPANARGAQLSIVIDKGKAFFNYLMENGVIGDWREPDVIRLAPAPLYCSFADVYKCYQVFQAYKG